MGWLLKGINFRLHAAQIELLTISVTVSDDVPEWEKELQAELQEYEVVDDGNNIDDADLEREIMSQIEAEAKQA